MQIGNSQQRTVNSGLVLVKKPVQRAMPEAGVLREATTGRVVTMLPRVWAVAAVAQPVRTEAPEPRKTARPKVEVAFYRKYTEALLRRYSRFSSGVIVNAPVS